MCVCGGGGGGGGERRRFINFIKMARVWGCLICFLQYTCDFIYYLLVLLWGEVEAYMSSHMIACGIDVYSSLAVIFNILCLEVAYDSMRLFYLYLHYICDLVTFFIVSVSVPVFSCDGIWNQGLFCFCCFWGGRGGGGSISFYFIKWLVYDYDYMSLSYLHFYYYYWSLLYSAILCFRADSLHSRMILHEWIAFYCTFLNIHWSGVLTALAWLVRPHETASILAHSVYTIQPCTMSLHAKPHTQGVCVFSCNLPPALLAEWPGSFTCYCGNTGVERILK